MSKMIPSAVIHCTNKEELTKTLTELEELKFRWNGDGKKPTEVELEAPTFIHTYVNGNSRTIRYAASCSYSCITCSEQVSTKELLSMCGVTL